MYQVTVKPKARKRVLKFPKVYQLKVAHVIVALEKDPYNNSLDITKLSAIGKFYRVRVGNIRIAYEINSDIQTITIIKIDFRGNVY